MTKKIAPLLLALCTGLPLPALAIDLAPGDVQAPQPGLRMFQFSYRDSQREDYYVRGRKLPGDLRANATEVQLRFGAAFEMANKPAFVYVQVPYGYIDPKGALSALPTETGAGDTTLLLSIWPYANHETKTYFGVAGYLTLPTGSYNRNLTFNMGANRYSSALQAGFQTSLGSRVTWMTAVDTLWSSKNKDFGPRGNTQETDALYSAQTGLSYALTPQYSVAATYFYNAGGENRINGRYQDDAIRAQRYQVAGIMHLPQGRVTLQYGADFRTENGLLEKARWIMRYTHFF
jgi:hypothetical protein